MNEKLLKIGQKLIDLGSLEIAEYEYLIDNRNEEITEFLKKEAVKKRKEVYGNTVFIRGLIEISNICKNDCLYCGIRASNKDCERYRLAKDEILSCCDEGYSLGFRTFVMQGGEDGYFTDEILVEIIGEIKKKYPDCAVTLSLGERSYASYKKLFDAGADRYLLRHETADKEHYNKLHPNKMSYENRMECLKNLKELGFQTGCGFMVGSPYQTTHNLAKDLKFIEEFSPEMCGIGPFIPHKATEFKIYKAGDVELTCFLLSVIRLIKPTILLPATTALGSAEQGGREKGILCGANVIMPNLSPHSVRKKYELYNNKLISGNESAQEIENLKNSMKNIGYEIVTDRGDIKEK
ncbi:MAG: [FeFe] hydrogenase H-cluster radical SAM maturase HydE [Clostridia bacterium]|nr:[FeFe] hydrogenase H-cluster radical SAM maturase HydE [Clostridia bacterium]